MARFFLSYTMTFEDRLHEQLQQFLCAQNELDAQFPEAPDIEEKWSSLGEAYLPDGIREFREYPTVSLGWIMYVGMAVAQYWDEEWTLYGKIDNLYTFLRDKEGFDTLDEYIRREVLSLTEPEFSATETLVQECAERTYAMLGRERIESGTSAAFEAYIACLHQLYLMGSAVQLHRLGYKMQKL